MSDLGIHDHDGVRWLAVTCPYDTIVSRDQLAGLLISATRYALGRVTYIVGDTVDAIVQHAPRLDENTKHVLQRDISTSLGEAPGMECDDREWRRALDALARASEGGQAS